MMHPTPIPAPRRVLIIKPSALGDVVTALPVLRGLRRSFGPGVHVAWLIARPYAPLLSGEGELNEIVEFDRRLYGRLWRSPLAAAAFRQFRRRLREGDYDWVIDLQGLFRSGYFASATRAAVRAGFSTAREGAPLFYNHTLPPVHTPAHTVDRNIALARSLGIDARPEDYRLGVPPEGHSFAERFAADHGPGYLVIAPAARWTTKLYPARHWRTVIDALARRLTVALVAGADEAHLTAPLAGGANVIDLAGKTSLPELVGLIAGSRGVVSGDSAVMNIATATGVPQVTIVGPTDPARTGPYRRPQALVQTHLPCRACLKRRCRHVACMELIAPAEVLAAAERNLFEGEG